MGTRSTRNLYWEYEPIKVIQNVNGLELWDGTVHTNKTVVHNLSDVIVKDKKKPIIICMKSTNQHKIDKYRELAAEIEKLWRTKTRILPIK